MSRCLYCDFFSTTLLERRHDYAEALLKEIALRRNEWLTAETIYFGGGTPSLMPPDDLVRLLQAIGIDNANEITLEANPGDITPSLLQAWRQAGFNRLSIGIQSFDDSLLRRIGRRHTASQAVQTVQQAQSAGFDNLSIDLMYGLPEQTMTQWQADIRQALQMGVQHISCYCLSYEEGTPLTLQLQQGQIEPQDEQTLNDMYDMLSDMLSAQGFEHYEVSNFALPGFRSQHNSSYWNDTPYVGLGAGAHSYRIETHNHITRRIRSWNVSDLDTYIQAIHSNELPSEQEELTTEQHRMEQIMLSLRTAEGVAKHILTRNQTPADCQRILKKAEQYEHQGCLRQTPTHLVATRYGLHILNRIIEDLL